MYGRIFIDIQNICVKNVTIMSKHSDIYRSLYGALTGVPGSVVSIGILASDVVLVVRCYI